MLCITVLGFAYVAHKSSDRVIEAIPTVGGLFNLSGYGAFAGEASRDGFILTLEDSGASSSTIQSVIEDTHSDLKTAVGSANKLIHSDKVIAVVGPEWTEFGEVISPVARDNKVPFFSPWVVADAPFVEQPYFWSMTPSDRPEHSALAVYMKEHNLKRVAVVSSKNFWSDTNLSMFKEEASKVGLEIVSQYNLEQSTTDFRTVVAQIKKDSPDVIYAVIATDDGYGAFLKQLRELHSNLPVGTHSARATSGVLKDRFPNLLHNQIFAEMEKPKRADEFATKYQTRFSKQVGAPSASASYDATTILIKAIQSGARNSNQIISFIKKMQPYEGYSGLIKFDDKGNLPLRSASVKGFDQAGNVVGLR